MGKSRNDLKKSLLLFNSRASTTWSKDESKFGQRMLEKMGWKKGEGLGLHHQGITDNIKLRLKLDAKGLGFKLKDDQWLQVEHGFSSVLSKLKEQADTNPESSNSSETKSLESKSLKSKSRVHYHKYTRGKDVSRYNDEDLIGILGQSRKRRLEENTEINELPDIECAKKKIVDGELSNRELNFSSLDIVSADQNDCKEINEEENECDEFAESPAAVSNEIPSNNVLPSEYEMRSTRKKSKDNRKKRTEYTSPVEKDSSSSVRRKSKKVQFIPESDFSSLDIVSTNRNDCQEINNRENAYDEFEDSSSIVPHENPSDNAFSKYETESARKKSKDNKKKRTETSSIIENDPSLSLQRKSTKTQRIPEPNFYSSELLSMEQNDCKDINGEQYECDKIANLSKAVSLENSSDNAQPTDYEMRGARKKSKDSKKKRTKTSSPIKNDPSLSMQTKSTKIQRIPEPNFCSSEFMSTKQNDCEESNDEQNECDKLTNSSKVVFLENSLDNAQLEEYEVRSARKKSKDIKKKRTKNSSPIENDPPLSVQEKSPRALVIPEPNVSSSKFMSIKQNDCEEIYNEEKKSDKLLKSKDNALISENEMKRTRKKSKDSKKKQTETSLQIEDNPSLCVRRECSKAQCDLDPNFSSNQNDYEESKSDKLKTSSTARSFENSSDNVPLDEYEMRSSRKKSKDNEKKRMKISLPIKNNPTLSLQKKSVDQLISEPNFSSSEFVSTKQNDCKETNDKQNNCDEFAGYNSVTPFENSSDNASCNEYKMRSTEKKSEDSNKKLTETSWPSIDSTSFHQLPNDDPTFHLSRKLTKYERIIAKSRILKQLQLGTTNHEFIGSNLTKINGYGNEDRI